MEYYSAAKTLTGKRVEPERKIYAFSHAESRHKK
jgi:hypothetical protein